MKMGVIRDVKEYVKQYWKIILTSVAAMIVCYGFLVFSGNIRIDTEELINEPGTKLGWLTIGRFGLAFLKDLLGLGTHQPIKSGILFLGFFALGAVLLTGAIYHYSERKKYPYWIFLLLYMTSNIWSFQIYFSVQQAEVACAMFLLVVAAVLIFDAFFETCGMGRVWRLVLGMALLLLGLGAYQALAAYYIAICIVLFLAYLDKDIYAQPAGGQEQKMFAKKLFGGVFGLILTFAVAYVMYRFIANTWFMATADYMEGQMGWGKYTILDCVKNVLRTVKNVVIGIGPRNFSFYTVGVLLTLWLMAIRLKERLCGNDAQKGQGTVFWLRNLALVGLMATPFLMTIYMGEMLVTRSQFALPVVAAFFGMYAVSGLAEKRKAHSKKMLVMCRICVLFVVMVQTLYNFRLTMTDEVRNACDVTLTEQLVDVLCEANEGVFPSQPVVFVGYQEPELKGWCRRTEMYGWSFYGWDYSRENPTGPTHRIAGFVQAYTGYEINEEASDEQRRQAVEMAEEMPDFPERGSVEVTEEMVVVRLSEVTEQEMSDWW